MSTLATLLLHGLLVLAVFCTRPPAIAAAIRARLMLQVVLLCACLLAHALSDRAPAPALACSLAVMLEAGVLLAWWRRWPESGSTLLPAGRMAWPVVAGVLVAWLAFRVWPVAGAAGQGAPALGIVFCALIGLLAAPTARGRQAALLLAGHGVLAFVGTVPGAGWPGVAMAIMVQGVMLAPFRARPVWSDEVQDASNPAGNNRGATGVPVP